MKKLPFVGARAENKKEEGRQRVTHLFAPAAIAAVFLSLEIWRYVHTTYVALCAPVQHTRPPYPTQSPFTAADWRPPPCAVAPLPPQSPSRFARASGPRAGARRRKPTLYVCMDVCMDRVRCDVGGRPVGTDYRRGGAGRPHPSAHAHKKRRPDDRKKGIDIHTHIHAPTHLRMIDPPTYLLQGLLRLAVVPVVLVLDLRLRELPHELLAHEPPLFMRGTFFSFKIFVRFTRIILFIYWFDYIGIIKKNRYYKKECDTSVNIHMYISIPRRCRPRSACVGGMHANWMGL